MKHSDYLKIRREISLVEQGINASEGRRSSKSFINVQTRYLEEVMEFWFGCKVRCCFDSCQIELSLPENKKGKRYRELDMLERYL